MKRGSSIRDTLFESLQKYYTGFFLSEPKGNNAFSFSLRKQKSIYVAPVIQGEVSDLAIGDEPAFSEIVQGVEINTLGLRHFVYWQKQGQSVFIFDNHNHAFFFWLAAVGTGRLRAGFPLIHIDQHTDLRDPPADFQLEGKGEPDLCAGFHYTNHVFNVGNFLKPALRCGFFSAVEMINSSTSFERRLEGDFVLDLDMDIFSPQMDYIDENVKVQAVRHYLRKAKVITIATSPFFMDQQEAIGIIRELWEGL